MKHKLEVLWRCKNIKLLNQLIQNIFAIALEISIEFDKISQHNARRQAENWKFVIISYLLLFYYKLIFAVVEHEQTCLSIAKSVESVSGQSLREDCING